MLGKSKYEFEPPVNRWDTDDLIFIANDETLFWDEDAVRQAREELDSRGVSSEYEQSVVGDEAKWNLHGERLIELGGKKLENNASEDYKTVEIFAILCASPLILLGKADVGDPLSVLKSENYKLKYRKRALLLVLGVVMWTLIILLASAIGSQE